MGVVVVVVAATAAVFYFPHALCYCNQRIQIREKMPEFSSTVLSTLSPYLFLELMEDKSESVNVFLLVPAHLGSPGLRAIEWLCVCVCVCVRACVCCITLYTDGSGMSPSV